MPEENDKLQAPAIIMYEVFSETTGMALGSAHVFLSFIEAV